MIEILFHFLVSVVPSLAFLGLGWAIGSRAPRQKLSPYFDPRLGDVIEWKPLGENILVRGVFDGWSEHAEVTHFYVKVSGGSRKSVRLHDQPRVVVRVTVPSEERTVETPGTYREPARKTMGRR